MPYHVHEDTARETSAEGGGIGTTRRGIGPTYADKMQASTAIGSPTWRTKTAQAEGRVDRHRANKVLKVLYDAPPIELAGHLRNLPRLRPSDGAVRR
jgi:adenylosuccinate synthase